MRTTLTIDDNLMAALKKRAYESGKSFKAVVNETLVAGLRENGVPAKPRQRFESPSFDLGEPLMDLTKANQLAGMLEDEELIRKMEQRK